MRSILSALLFLHGLAHVAGFIGPLELVSQPPFRTVVFQRTMINQSPVGRSLGAAWLLLAFAFSVASVAIVVQASWWFPYTALVLFASLFLCVTAWPMTKLGVLVNFALLLACLVMQRAQLWADLVALLRVLPF